MSAPKRLKNRAATICVKKVFTTQADRVVLKQVEIFLQTLLILTSDIQVKYQLNTVV